MDKDTIKKKIKELETEIRHTTNRSYKQLLERRLEAYMNLLPKARTLHKLDKADKVAGSRTDQLLAAWQKKFKGANPHDYIDY